MLLKSKVKVNHSERVYCLRLQITILGYTALTLQRGASDTMYTHPLSNILLWFLLEAGEINNFVVKCMSRGVWADSGLHRILPLMPKLDPPSQPRMTYTQMYSAENIIKTIYFSFAELRKFLELWGRRVVDKCKLETGVQSSQTCSVHSVTHTVYNFRRQKEACKHFDCCKHVDCTELSDLEMFCVKPQTHT